MRGVPVRRRVDGDRLDSELPQGADHADGDLAAVRDQNASEHSVPRPVTVTRHWRVTGAARQGRRERQYRNEILARLRTPVVPGAARGALTVAGWGTLKAGRAAVDRLELEQELAVLDRLGVLRDDPADDPLLLGLDLVHQLHRLQNAERLADRNGVTLLDERRRAGRRGPVE